jgi:hypothetical protein
VEKRRVSGFGRQVSDRNWINEELTQRKSGGALRYTEVLLCGTLCELCVSFLIDFRKIDNYFLVTVALKNWREYFPVL